MRVIVGMTGASGAVYGVRLLEKLKRHHVETHLVISKWGEKTLRYETSYSPEDLKALSDYSYPVDDMAARISSGSFPHDGMVIAPCSMKTLGAIAGGYADNLIARAADAALKERRKLILMTRETPLSLIHLRNMTAVTEAGAIIAPPLPAFYTRPQTADDIIDQSTARVLDLLGIENDLTKRWQGESPDRQADFTAGEGRYAVRLSITRFDEGIAAVLTGGEKAHVGAVALAAPADTESPCGIPAAPADSRSQTLVLPGHKDDLVARETAAALCEALGEPVSVSAGLHIDDASREEIDRLVANCRAVTARAVSAIAGHSE